MRKSDFTLPTLDDLFSTQAERDDAKLERVRNIPLAELHPFKGHPFKVQNNEEMQRMIESIRKVGAITPVLARPLPGGGYLIDTPGIKGFGTFDIGREELTSYFREIFHFSKDCRFNNCTHTHEPGCAVRKAVEDHYIAESRYQSYLSMLDDQEEGKYREAY